MEAPQNIENNDMKITRNTTISIGLGITLFVAVFWGAATYGAIKEKQNQLEKKVESVDDKIESFMPRQEVDTNLTNIQEQLKDIKETQKEILLKLN